MALRKFTFEEWFWFTLAAARVRGTVDRELSELLLRVGRGAFLNLRSDPHGR
jgi:hypothetical protein